jgi:hypothetical protein
MNKMMHISFPIVFVTCVLPCFAQNHVTDTTAEIVAYWKKGDRQLYDIIRICEKYFNNQLVYKTIHSSVVNITILEETDSMYKIEWHITETFVSEAEEPVIKRLSEMSEGLKILYQTSETGIFQHVLNPADIQAHFAKALHSANQQYGYDTINMLLAQRLHNIFAENQCADAAFASIIRSYHFPLGAEYRLHQTSKETQLLPHSAPNDTTEDIIQVRLIEINLPSMTATLQCVRETPTFYARHSCDVLAPLSPHHAATTLLSDTSVYTFELMTGWLQSMQHLQTSAVDYLIRKDITTIRKRN